ncbi:MarR family transcriptional regulator [Tsukamurella sp. NPDC003166]|uniref:MarR family winged helix-turn-helix transcriptional regulator n=1 Tax=Tsukamurella sp. NPDC003166 TaxID=3154444 RepID=UPI0033B91CB1
MLPGDAEALRLAVGLLGERLRRLPAAGLRGSELFVLATVETLGPEAFPTAIGDRLEMKRSNVSAAIADLRRRGFLQGDADGSDGRRRPVALTERGRAVLHARDAAQDAWLVDTGGKHLTADETAQLRGSIPLLLRLAGG